LIRHAEMGRVPNRKVCLCGVQVDAVGAAEVIAEVRQAVHCHSPFPISVVNVAKVVHMRHDPVLRRSVQAGKLVLADGVPLVWLSRLRNRRLPERVAGIDLMYRLLDLANQEALRVYFLGAEPQVLNRVLHVVRQDYPQLVIAGYHHGYFADRQEEDLARDIRHAHPDILLVAISSPKKELFMQCWGEYINAPVCHGVGGSFDVMVGLRRRAPLWMQRCGLEWLYRLAQEPRRMWKRYLRTNLVFAELAPFCLFCRREHPDGNHCPWIDQRGGWS